MIRLSRRYALAAPALGLLAAARPAPARADSTTDLVLATDPPLAPALQAAATAYHAQEGVRVHVFATPSHLLLPQLQRTVQNDLVFTTLPVLAALAGAGLLVSPPGAAWANPLVLAGADAATPITPTTRLARPDATDGSALDGAAVLAAIGLGGNPSLGAIDTPAVAWLLRQRSAPAGLVHASLLHGLHMLRPVPAAAAGPVVAAGAISRLARRPHPEHFLAFLASPPGRARLRQGGLQEHTA